MLGTERYRRQQAVQGLGLDRLRALRVVLVGAGAVGNEALKNLVLMGVGTIDVLDFDHVEIHNLTRSIFLREADVGASKAAAVVARAAPVDPHVKLRAIEGDAWRRLRLSDLERCDALICAVDNLEARQRLSQLCQLAGVNLVNAGIDSQCASVEFFPYRMDGVQACLECHWPASAYQRLAQRYSCGWLRRAMLQQAQVPTTAITASMAGALAVQAVLHPPQRAQRILMDTRGGTSTVVGLPRNEGCAGCGPLWPRPRRLHAGQRWRSVLRSLQPAPEAVMLSDPLIFAYGCAACGDPADASRFVGHRADEFDDRIMRCSACHQVSVRVDIRSEVRMEDLLSAFPTAAPPVKYLLALTGTPNALCIDLEE